MPHSIVPKDAAKARAGLASARRRWGDPGVVQLAELTPEQRRLVLALVEAARAVNRDARPSKRVGGYVSERRSGP